MWLNKIGILYWLYGTVFFAHWWTPKDVVCFPQQLSSYRIHQHTSSSRIRSHMNEWMTLLNHCCHAERQHCQLQIQSAFSSSQCRNENSYEDERINIYSSHLARTLRHIHFCHNALINCQSNVWFSDMSVSPPRRVVSASATILRCGRENNTRGADWNKPSVCPLVAQTSC